MSLTVRRLVMLTCSSFFVMINVFIVFLLLPTDQRDYFKVTLARKIGFSMKLTPGLLFWAGLLPRLRSMKGARKMCPHQDVPASIGCHGNGNHLGFSKTLLCAQVLQFATSTKFFFEEKKWICSHAHNLENYREKFYKMFRMGGQWPWKFKIYDFRLKNRIF